MKNRRSSKKRGGKKNNKKNPTQNLKQNHGAVAAASPPLTCDINAAINNEHSCRHGGTKFDNVSTKICLKYLSYDGEWDWEDLSRAIVEANPAEDFVANLYGFAASQCQICELYTVDQQLASIGAARSGSKTVSPNCFTKFVKAAIFFEKGRPYNAGLTSQKHFLELMGDEVETEKYLRMNWCCTKHCGSMRDVVLYVDKKIPCDCLKDMKKKLLEEPEVRRCSNCGKGKQKQCGAPTASVPSTAPKTVSWLTGQSTNFTAQSSNENFLFSMLPRNRPRFGARSGTLEQLLEWSCFRSFLACDECTRQQKQRGGDLQPSCYHEGERQLKAFHALWNRSPK